MKQIKTTKLTAENTKLFGYTGSKSKYSQHFDKLHTKANINKQVHTYIEAFAGTLASMFHNLTQIRAERIIINDLNPMIINLYQQIKSNPQEVIETFKLLENTFQDYIPTELKGKGFIKCKSTQKDKLSHLQVFYTQARDYYNKKELTSNSAAVMIFIMQHNFNGLYQEGKRKGNFNSSFNWDMKKININRIIDNIMNLHYFFNDNNVIFESIHAIELIEKYQDTSDTCIYLDPPYINSNVRYSANQTTDYSTLEAHKQLLEKCKVFDFVIFSNHKNDELINNSNTHVEFSRTNNLTKTVNEDISKIEILCFINNKINRMPTIESLLNIMPSIDNLLDSKQTLQVINKDYFPLHTA